MPRRLVVVDLEQVDIGKAATRVTQVVEGWDVDVVQFVEHGGRPEVLRNPLRLVPSLMQGPFAELLAKSIADQVSAQIGLAVCRDAPLVTSMGLNALIELVTGATLHHAGQLLKGMGCVEPVATRVRLRVTTVCVKHAPSEAQLATFAVVVRAVESVVLAVALDDGPHREELGLAVLRRHHVAAIGRHNLVLAFPGCDVASKLVRLVEGAVHEVGRVVVGCLVKGVEERTA